jgi:hypothetical protein
LGIKGDGKKPLRFMPAVPLYDKCLGWHKRHLQLLATAEVNVKKLLEAANRFCTRWVRLDI